MRKGFKELVLVVSMFILPFSVNALDTNITTKDELVNCINEGGKCIIANDISAGDITINAKDVTIDLNGQKLTSRILLENKANLVLVDSKGNGELYNDNDGVNVKASSASKFTLESGTITATRNISVATLGGTFIMNGGKIVSQEMGVAYYDKSNVTINKGTIETKDNCAISDNGTEGRGGNTVTVNGGNLISNIQSAGYISCGIYNANDTTLTVKSGTKITANKGGAGIVIRGGKVTVDNQVINDMVTGKSQGKVGDSRVIVSGKVVKDYSSNYPAMNTIDVQINYNTVSDKEGTSTILNKQTNVLNEEIKKIINSNKIAELSNVDLADISIKTTVNDAKDDAKKEAISKTKDVVKDFKVGKVLDLGVVVNNKDSLVANITETSNKIPFGIDVSSITKDSNLNYEFQVVRLHTNDNGEESVEVLNSSYDPENNVVTFESDKFSTYMINYKTSEKSNNTANSSETVQNPKTFDGIAISVVVGLISLFGLIKTVKTIEKRG